MYRYFLAYLFFFSQVILTWHIFCYGVRRRKLYYSDLTDNGLQKLGMENHIWRDAIQETSRDPLKFLLIEEKI
jgi:hypothetical protein